MKKKIAIFFLCVVNAWCVNTGWCKPYPIITRIDPVWHSGTGNNQMWNFYITQGVIDVGNAADYVPKSTRSEYVQLFQRAHATSTPGSGEAIGVSTQGVFADGVSSLSDLAMRLYRTNGILVTDIPHGGAAPSIYDCIAYAYAPHTGALLWSEVKTPGGCLSFPPVNEWCKITTPEILLDHGQISLRNAEGHSASSSVDVQCIDQMAVSFKLITDDKYVYLDEGKSEITLDNKPLNTQITLPAGQSTLSIKDVLTGVTSEGAHTGSSVLVMMPY
ncbi:hypothetical protein SLY17_003137 [Cronobacter dublinensis]|nr:hypothetical protein [Cronobacter dublinensis]